MPRYIDADALIKTIYPICIPNDWGCLINAKAVKAAIDKQPTAYVEKVVRGHWIEEKRTSLNIFNSGATDWEVDVLVCSNCGLTLDYVDYHRAYCESCGAKMEDN